MDILTAIIYGFIQGLSEFLPVSSSGHLALLPYLMELQDPGVVFDLLMHLGTAFAVICYFSKEVMELIRQGLNFLCTRDYRKNAFAVNFVIATTASVILILVLKDLTFEFGRSKNLIAYNLIFFGILMYLADRRQDRAVDLAGQWDWKRSVLIGLAQALAVFPGVSRSGITMTMGRTVGMGRESAGRFSFLLSLPIILASILHELPAVIKGEATSVALPIIFVGVLVSGLVGLLTIHFFLKLISKIGLGFFTFYRIVLGVAILLL